MTLVETLIRNQFDPKQDRYIKIHSGLMKYFNNLDYSIYFQYLIMTSNYFKEKKKQDNPWFYIDSNNMRSFLPDRLVEKSRRHRTDKFLEELGLIESKVEKLSFITRKYYKLNFKNIEKLAKKIELRGSHSESPGSHSENNTNNTTNNTVNSFSYRKRNNKRRGILRSSESSTLAEEKSLLNYRRKSSPDKTSIDSSDKKNTSKIISHWISLGPPFAKIRDKPLAIKKILRQFNALSSKTSNPVSLIIDTINTGHKYFSDEDFSFRTKSNITLSSFFSPLKFTTIDPDSNGYKIFNNKIYNTIKPLVKEKRKSMKPSWFNLFLLYPDSELDKILLKGIPYSKLENNMMYNLLSSTFQNHTLDRENVKILYRASILADKYMEANSNCLNFNLFEPLWKQWTDGQHSLKPYHLLSKNFWNNSFGRYLEEDINIFGDYGRVDI